MHNSIQTSTEDRLPTRQKWQEPKILVERRLNGNAQEPDPNAAPLFGPFSTSNS
jgi:hypothetical protein